MKWFLRILLGVVALAIIGLVLVVLLIDPIAKTAVEKGGTYAMGVDTKVDTMSIGLTSGDVKMVGLQVANPEGFKSDYLMKSGTFAVGVRPGSLMGQTIEVREFTLDGLDVNIEQTGAGTNISKIMDNLKKLSSKDQGAEKPKEQPSEGKKVSVNTITIKNVAAHFYLGGLTGSKGITVKVPLIEMKGVTSDNAKGVAMHELVARVVPAILASIIENAKGAVDTKFLGDMSGQLKGVADALGGQVGNLMGQTSKQLGEGLNNALKAVPTDAIKKPLENLFKPSK
jgi:hypothetical protein